MVGPNNVSGRLLSVISGLAVVSALLAVTMRGERSAWYLVVAAALILGSNNRSEQYFAENRPDMTALPFGAAGVLLIAAGQERRRWLLTAIGTACLVTGFFFKQTAFLILWCRPPGCTCLALCRPDRSELILAGLPLAVSVGVILALKIVKPTVYHYMIYVPKAFGLDWIPAPTVVFLGPIDRLALVHGLVRRMHPLLRYGVDSTGPTDAMALRRTRSRRSPLVRSPRARSECPPNSLLRRHSWR